jgi:hypothetical protein
LTTSSLRRTSGSIGLTLYFCRGFLAMDWRSGLLTCLQSGLEAKAARRVGAGLEKRVPEQDNLGV